MKKELTYYGNPVLRKKCAPVEQVTEELKRFIQDMEDTMIASNGLGIAAPQLGRALAICITRCPIENELGEDSLAPAKLYINPKLTNPSDEHWVHEEGCLSIPKVYADVDRPVSITVTAQDINGKEFTENLSGWPARVLMHENDHLNGVLFIDRISKKKRNELEAKLRKIKKEHP